MLRRTLTYTVPQEIVGVQFTSLPDPSENLRRIINHVTEIKKLYPEVNVIAFPEASAYCFGQPGLREAAYEIARTFPATLKHLAVSNNVLISVGGFLPAGEGKVTNTMFIAAPNRDLAYHKIHLYDAYGFTESKTVAAGSRLVTVMWNGCTIGFATCYDVRFPEQYKALAARGAQLIITGASWQGGAGKTEMWRQLASTRALDATTFHLAVDQAVPPPQQGAKGPVGVGHSLLAGPDGRVLAELGENPGYLHYRLDLAEVEKIREQIPVLANSVHLL